MCRIRLCMPARVSCYVNTRRDTLTAFMDVRAVITLMDIMTDSSSRGDIGGGAEAGRCCRLFAERNERTEKKPLWHTDVGAKLIVSSYIRLLTRSHLHTVLPSPALPHWCDMKPKSVCHYVSYRTGRVEAHAKPEGEHDFVWASCGLLLSLEILQVF